MASDVFCGPANALTKFTEAVTRESHVPTHRLHATALNKPTVQSTSLEKEFTAFQAGEVLSPHQVTPGMDKVTTPAAKPELINDSVFHEHRRPNRLPSPPIAKKNFVRITEDYDGLHQKRFSQHISRDPHSMKAFIERLKSEVTDEQKSLAYRPKLKAKL